MPLGICALKSYLVKNGQEATIIDLNLKTYFDSENKKLWDWKYTLDWFYEESFYKKILPQLDINKMLGHILSEDADIIGFSTNLSSIYSSLILTKKIKEHSQKKVVFGGIGCHEDIVEGLLRAGVDAIVMGEGEEAFLELVRDFKLCQGVYMLQDDKVVYGGSRKLLNVDTLPFADFDDIIDDYRKFDPDVQVSFSFLRGCTNRCVYCSESAFWQKARQRSEENIINELKHIKSKYNANGFFKADSILTISAESLYKICDLMIENNLNMKWGSQARAEKWLSPELLQKMVQAGFTYVSFGVETGSQKMLDKMKKNYNIKEVQLVIKNTNNAGIDVFVNLMVDSPGETWVDFIKTVLFVLKTRKHVIAFSPIRSNIPPHSNWYNNPSKYKIIIDSPLRWHSKYYFNNFITAGIKKYILKLIIKAIYFFRRKS
jgi:radical SAM superfamily enzyme YgiQ (UPF0313 family)